MLCCAPVTEEVRKMGASASESMWRAHVSTSARVRTMNGRFLTPGLRRMSCSELSVCLSTCSGQISTCNTISTSVSQGPWTAAACSIDVAYTSCLTNANA